MVVDGTDSGKPAASTALRPTFTPWAPTCMTQPMTTSSMTAGSMPLRSTSAFRVSAARSAGCQPDSFPLRFPPAVRTASTMTAVAMRGLLQLDRTVKSLAFRGEKGNRAFREDGVMKDMDRWLGDGGMPIIEAIGGSIDAYGDGYCDGAWKPAPLACNPHGIVQAVVQS